MSERLGPDDRSRTWRTRSPEPNPAEARSQKRDLLAEQQEDWAADRPAPPEHYLERWPTDPKADPDAASVRIGPAESALTRMFFLPRSSAK